MIIAFAALGPSYDESLRWLLALAGAYPGLRLGPTTTANEKAKFIRTANPKLAIDLRFEGAGAACYCRPGQEAIAWAIYKPLAKVFPPGRGVAPGYYRNDPNRGLDFFLARAHCPAVIVVPGAEAIVERRGSGIAAIAIGLRAALSALDALAATRRASPPAPEGCQDPDDDPQSSSEQRQEGVD